jgi:hypothetical protein
MSRMRLPDQDAGNEMQSAGVGCGVVVLLVVVSLVGRVLWLRFAFPRPHPTSVARDSR